VDEFVEHAVSLLHEQEALAEHGTEIRTKIEQGYEQLRTRRIDRLGSGSFQAGGKETCLAR
jgi:hypothetical protein